MRIFEIGDRVVCKREYDGKALAVGVSGTVIGRMYGDGLCGVRFDKDISGHDLFGRCEDGYGWWIPDECLVPETGVACQPPELDGLF